MATTTIMTATTCGHHRWYRCIPCHRWHRYTPRHRWYGYILHHVIQVHTLSGVTQEYPLSHHKWHRYTPCHITGDTGTHPVTSQAIQVHTLSHHRWHRYTPCHITGDTGTYLVTGNTRWQVEQMHHFKNERHQTEYVGICQQLHKCPLIVLADTIVYPKHNISSTRAVRDATNNWFNQPLFWNSERTPGLQ